MERDPQWAHVRITPDSPQGIPHRLIDHLQAVSAGAATHARAFGQSWASLAGLWHDLGKYRPGFQRYIRQANGFEAHIEGRVKDRDKTHSAAGAIWAERLLVKRYGKQGRMMARALQYAIAGHHAGLDNWDGGLAVRLASADAQNECDEALAMQPPPEILLPHESAPGFACRSWRAWIETRMASVVA